MMCAALAATVLEDLLHLASSPSTSGNADNIRVPCDQGADPARINGIGLRLVGEELRDSLPR
jgi:hypothetical protein